MEPGWKQAEPQIVYCCAYTAEGLGVCGLKEGHIFFFGKVKATTPQECIYRIHGVFFFQFFLCVCKTFWVSAALWCVCVLSVRASLVQKSKY
jgi:hypothetical protein